MRIKSLLLLPAMLAVACLVGCSAEEPSAAKAPASSTGTGSPPAAPGGTGGSAGTAK